MLYAMHVVRGTVRIVHGTRPKSQGPYELKVLSISKPIREQSIFMQTVLSEWARGCRQNHYAGTKRSVMARIGEIRMERFSY